MLIFSRNSLICVLLVLVPVACDAMSRIKDAEAVITMRNGNHCFSYPQDEEIRKRPYMFGGLSVSKNGPYGEGGWEIGIANSERKSFRDPNSPKTCIEYGVIDKGLKEIEAAKALSINTPYRVLLVVYARSGGAYYERKYLSDFCIDRNEKEESLIVGAAWDDKADAWRCLKPGEAPKRGFCQRLFGK